MSVTSVGPIPAEIPLPHINPHEFVRFDIAQSTPREWGDIRRRVRFRSVAQRAGVRWLLTQSEYDVFHSWYENILKAGESAFDLQLALQGDLTKTQDYQTAWYKAQFEEPYQTETSYADGGLTYYVNARLILFGPGSSVRVDTPLQAKGSNASVGSAVFVSPLFRSSGTNTNDGGVYYTSFLVRPSLASLQVKGWAPFLVMPRVISSGQGSISIAGQVSTVTKNLLRPASGDVLITGQTPSLTLSEIKAGVGSVVLFGLQPISSITVYYLYPDRGLLAISGQVPTVVVQ